MAEPSVAVKMPPMMPPITTTIRESAGRARRVQTPRFFQSNFPGRPLYPFFFAIRMATAIQQIAQRMPGTYPAMNSAATEVPPAARE